MNITYFQVTGTPFRRVIIAMAADGVTNEKNRFQAIRDSSGHAAFIQQQILYLYNHGQHFNNMP